MGNKSHKYMNQTIYYTPSGHCGKLGLLFLFLAVVATSTILPIFYIFCLRSAHQPGIILAIVSLVVPVVTICLNSFISMGYVKWFKVRSPGLTFCTVGFAALLGYFFSWSLAWLISQKGLNLSDFVLIAYCKLENKSYVYWGLILFGLYGFVCAIMAFFQAGRPFNEEQNRWFRRKGLRPVKVSTSFYKDFSNIISNGDVTDFFTSPNYNYRIISNIGFIFNPKFSIFLYKFWLYYDKNSNWCYISIQERSGYGFAPYIRLRKISRSQGKLLNRILA